MRSSGSNGSSARISGAAEFAIGPYVHRSTRRSPSRRVDGGRPGGSRLVDPSRAVREGRGSFRCGRSAHEALRAPFARHLKVVQFPASSENKSGPHCRRPGGRTTASHLIQQVPEELRDYLAAKPGTFRIATLIKSAPADGHCPACARRWTALAADGTVAAFVCDEWPEFIPDRSRPRASDFTTTRRARRPPQTILLALPPKLGQDAWSFDDAVDLIHEAFDLAKLRGVSPCDLAGGLGANPPGTICPHTYTTTCRAFACSRCCAEARQRLTTFAGMRPRSSHWARSEARETPCAIEFKNLRHR